jgi:hypothetical protein
VTTTATPTREELHAQLEDYRRQASDAEAAIGAAALDNTSPSAVARQKRLKAARDGAEVTEAALAELDRREQEAAQREREAAASAGRKLNYEWLAAYAELIEPVLALQAQLREAEERLLAHGRVRGGGKFHNANAHYRLMDATSIDLDTALVEALPQFPKKGPAHNETLAVWRNSYGQTVGTPERARELREMALQRVAQEEAGEGIDYSGVEPAGRRERIEARRKARADAKEAQRLADEEAHAKRLAAKEAALAEQDERVAEARKRKVARENARIADQVRRAAEEPRT